MDRIQAIRDLPGLPEKAQFSFTRLLTKFMRIGLALNPNQLASLIQGFEYDIFISYRHNDNLDGWVNIFVQHLEKELKGTIKQSLTIYFDKDPIDGLLETHDVGKSLEGKLKCQIFIPILSQTYADPASFAWQHEFCAFKRSASDDSYGLSVKLTNGNVTSRILPVKIHDLDADDNRVIENEIGGVLRCIEFIYKEPGVNRPLKVSDSKSDNLNKTDYHNQINKVAHAIKEITQSLQHSPAPSAPRPNGANNATRRFSRRMSGLALIALILSGSAYFLSAKFYRPSDVESIDKSIAVLPFDDMSPGKDQEYLGDGIAEEVITALSRIKDLKVIGRTSSFQFKGDKIDLRDVGEKLDVATVLEGSVQKSGNNVRVTAQLIRVSDGSHIWSERYDRNLTDIFAIQDEISSHIADKLKFTLFERSSASTESVPTKNMEAYEMWLKGNYFARQGPAGHQKAIDFFQKAIQLDSTYADAYVGLAWGYFLSFENNTKWLEKVRNSVNKALTLDRNVDTASDLMLAVYMYEWNWTEAKREYDKGLASNPEGTVAHAVFLKLAYGDYQKSIVMLEAIVKKDPLNFGALRNLGSSLSVDRQYEEARKVYKKMVEIDPAFGEAYVSIGWNYFLEGNYELAYETYAKATPLLPENNRALARCRIITLAHDNKKSEALKEFQKFKELNKEYNLFHAEINFALGNVNEAFRLLDEAYDKREPYLVYLKTSPTFDPYRHDSRFQEIMRKMNFPEK